ncbi:MAG: hypothetical protein H0W39_01160 [Sphingomonas sp.]|nr:hypothetical protein [Sphingomonas sp.]
MIRAEASTTQDAPPANIRSLGADVSALVDDWIAKHGRPRRFERGFTTEYLNLKLYLARHGVTFDLASNQCMISRGPGRPKTVEWAKVWQLVDEFRRAEGLEPILRGAK